MTDRATLEALLARVLEGNESDDLEREIALQIGGWTYQRKKWQKKFWWYDSDHNTARFLFGLNLPPPYLRQMKAVHHLADYLGISERIKWTAMKCPRDALAACLKARMEAQGE